jgi:hypothetical protein
LGSSGPEARRVGPRTETAPCAGPHRAGPDAASMEELALIPCAGIVLVLAERLLRGDPHDIEQDECFPIDDVGGTTVSMPPGGDGRSAALSPSSRERWTGSAITLPSPPL